MSQLLRMVYRVAGQAEADDGIPSVEMSSRNPV